MAEAANQIDQLTQNFLELLSGRGAKDDAGDLPKASKKAGYVAPAKSVPMKKAPPSSGPNMNDVPESDSDSDSEVEEAGASVFKDGFISGMSYTAALPTSAQQEARLAAVQAQQCVDFWADAPKPCLKYDQPEWVLMNGLREKYMKKVAKHVAKMGVKAKDMKVDPDTGVPTGGTVVKINGVNNKPELPILDSHTHKKLARKIARDKFGIQGYIPWKLMLDEDREGKNKNIKL